MWWMGGWMGGCSLQLTVMKQLLHTEPIWNWMLSYFHVVQDHWRQTDRSTGGAAWRGWWLSEWMMDGFTCVLHFRLDRARGHQQDWISRGIQSVSVLTPGLLERFLAACRGEATITQWVSSPDDRRLSWRHSRERSVCFCLSADMLQLC